jgi:3-methyladenine DNA glycosylase AlkD
VDAVCTGDYTISQLPSDWKKWELLLRKFSRDKNIHKRRASLVLLCSPVRHVSDVKLAEVALENTDRLKNEKHVLITKAISWLLRSMVKNHKKRVQSYVQKNSKTLPAIAVRETNTVLKTGKKTKNAP